MITSSTLDSDLTTEAVAPVLSQYVLCKRQSMIYYFSKHRSEHQMVIQRQLIFTKEFKFKFNSFKLIGQTVRFHITICMTRL